MVLRVVSLLLPASLLLWASLSSAFPSAQLEYVRGPGAESCPDEAAVRRAVAERLGYDPFDRVAPQLLRTRVARSSADAFSARLEVVDAGGHVQATRQLESARDCAELVAAMALSMSIVIDPEHADRSDGPPAPATIGSESSSSSTPDSAVPVPTPAPVAPPVAAAAQSSSAVVSSGATPAQPSPENPRARLYVVRVGAAGHLSFGAEPATTVGASAMLGVRQGPWSVALEGRYDAPASRALEPRGELTAQVISGSLVPCLHMAPLLFCGVAALGSLNANVSGVSDGHPDSALYAAAGARAGAEWPLRSWLSLQLAGDALFTLRPRSVLLNGQAVWEVPILTARVGAGFVAEF